MTSVAPLAGGGLLILLLAGCGSPAAPPAEAAVPAGPHVAAADEVAAGRYLVTVGGCNDCHTPRWDVAADSVPESAWLTGTSVGWAGPWGVTYPSNLRLVAAGMSETDFIRMLRTRKDRPPMPWMNVNRMNEADARAIYRYLRRLGPAGSPAPAAVPPGQTPKTPFIPIAPPTDPAAG